MRDAKVIWEKSQRIFKTMWSALLTTRETFLGSPGIFPYCIVIGRSPARTRFVRGDPFTPTQAIHVWCQPCGLHRSPKSRASSPFFQTKTTLKAICFVFAGFLLGIFFFRAHVSLEPRRTNHGCRPSRGWLPLPSQSYSSTHWFLLGWHPAPVAAPTSLRLMSVWASVVHDCQSRH